MKIDKYTKLYFSVSSNPGNFGATLYNSAFNYLGINAIYKPLYLDPLKDISNRYANLGALVRGLGVMGASGLSVSMPYKKAILDFDRGSQELGVARKIGNANTLIFSDSRTAPQYCHNTDWLGFLESTKDLLSRSDCAIVYGSGAVSDSICYALASIGKPYYVVGRMYHKSLNDGSIFSDFSKRMLINATPAGMDGFNDDVFSTNMLEYFNCVFDVVVKPETKLIRISKQLGKNYVSGWEMSKQQLMHQFMIYTGLSFPKEIMEKELSNMGFIK